MFLEGKGALITGGASGFGKGIAVAYAERGANLILVDINEESLKKVVAEIKQQYDSKVIPIVCDVSKSDQVRSMVKQAFKDLDNIYILHTNAGVGLNFGQDITRIDEDRFDKTLDINLKGQWLVAKEAAKKMKRQKFDDTPLSGKIICTASIAGMVVDAKIPAYSISKAGVIAMMQLLARTLAPKITVNAVSPGYHVTGIYLNSEEDMKVTMKMGNVKTPLNRIGTVNDVVNVMLFLASNKSNFITGHNIPVDGGIAEVGVPAYYFKSDI
jgi:NAD(P)-dependent dehydrogenase (short-subunit alcohol dehydrogenase family)